MVMRKISRRPLLLALAAFAAAPRQPKAGTVVDLDWADLMPEGTAAAAAPALSGVIQHEDAALASQQPVSTGVRTDWNGQTVRLPGFIVPLEYAGTGVISFILVPYVGACIHVPPPPANQLVLVTSDRPYQSSGLFEPVSVTGAFETAATDTDLAEIGYAITASRVERYR